MAIREFNEKAKTLEAWQYHLERIRQSMVNNGEEILADHLGSVIADINFQIIEQEERYPMEFSALLRGNHE